MLRFIIATDITEYLHECSFIKGVFNEYIYCEPSLGLPQGNSSEGPQNMFSWRRRDYSPGCSLYRAMVMIRVKYQQMAL